MGMERQEAAIPEKGGLNHGEMETLREIRTPLLTARRQEFSAAVTRMRTHRHTDTHVQTHTVLPSH